MDLKIAGKVALVLGASKGLGAASAAALADEGALVHAVSRSGAVSDARLTGLAADLSTAAGVEAVLELVARLGRVDILVGNTGGPPRSTAQGVDSGQWRAAFEGLAVSLFRIADAVLPGMIERGWGRIITIGSSGIVQPIPHLAQSNAVRGAVAGWSKTLAGEVGRHGVTVNMVLPGRIDTDRVRGGDEAAAARDGLAVAEVQARSRAQIPVGRYGRAEEFGAMVAYLAGEQAGYMTGTMIRVDGGYVRGL
ncbi:SDR family oxidoreductase [Novosphingobium flavum]|uniref:SDR family oxidoreductase n=1 Tax=Novosphingobium flavum TaxID=1778672 RepID=A0A7X1FSN5_9SPHN|nr:SDR family oxidoreductase [Novosphingobium flavum]MBC2666235.1 SDR family oxidoreductase [Novosphingobium flavum]